MKAKFIIMGLSSLVIAQAGAFSLDFSTNVGADLSSDLVIHVAGYGDVRFSKTFGSDLEIGTKYLSGSGVPEPSLQLDDSESVLISFLGDEPILIDFEYVGKSADEVFDEVSLGGSSYYLNLASQKDGAGLSGINFTTVPEPSTALLSLMALAVLFSRRR